MIDPVTGKKLPINLEDPIEVMQAIEQDLQRQYLDRIAKQALARKYGFSIELWKKFDKDKFPRRLKWW